MNEFTYQDAIDALYAFINYETKRQDRYSPEVMTLDRPAELLQRIGDPQNRYPIIHITGTKGKGSVGAMCASILQSAGYKVGLYSSPHLQDFRERLQINGDMIDKMQFAALVNELLPDFHAVEGVTWFEVVTALAFEYFAREQVDVAVIEVGLGGRLDATNVATPLVSVITSLSFDHTYLLGDTLAQIAFEKGGIIKPNVPVVIAPQKPEARETLVNIAAERGAPLTEVGRDYTFWADEPSVNGQRFSVSHHGVVQSFMTGLTGQHQAINATVVIATIEHMRQTLQISDTAIIKGLRDVNWPGRLEVVSDDPLTVLDAAHNRASAHVLKEAITTIFDRQPLILIFGAKADKDIAGMLDELVPVTDILIITQALDSRAEDPQVIADLARQSGYEGEIVIEPIVGQALRHARQFASSSGLICVTGSLYVVGEARTMLNLPVGQAMRPTPPSRVND